MMGIKKVFTQKNSVHKHNYEFKQNSANKDKINFKIDYLYFILIIFMILFSIREINNFEWTFNNYFVSNENQITLKVKGTGSASIFYSSFSNYPSKVMLNNNEISVKSSITLSSSSYENIVILIWNSQISNCDNMFSNCFKITEIDLSEFDGSAVTLMNNMFANCTSLTSINFKNFDTSSVKKMMYTFQNCRSLIYLDLSNFVTNNVYEFHHMFDGCKSLKYLDLSNFITSSCTCLQSMFYGCSSLTSLDLSNFLTSKVTLIYNMFYGCSKLEYVNLKNSVLSSSYLDSYSDYYGATDGTPKNIVFCVKQESFNFYRNYILSDSCSVLISDCNSNWRKSQKKLVISENTCIDSCSSHSNYRYEYLGICYLQCPSGTVNLNYICYDIPPDCKEVYPNNITLCKSCSDSSKYVKNGKCITSCSEGYYISSEDSTSKICDCNLKHCKECSLGSNSKKYCTSCNSQYYPVYNAQNNNDNLLDCYQSIEGYYLDKTNTQYYFKKCFDNCQSCNKAGNSQYHNCLTCKSQYEFGIDFNNFKNCYKKCDKYYYLDDSNTLYCTNTLNCPENYNKFIPDKKECVKECNKDNKYRYEFKKQCYEGCPKGTEENKNKLFYCEVKCTKQSPFEIIHYQNCTNFCEINDWKYGLCKSNYEDGDTNAELVLSNILYDLVNNKYEVFEINENNDIVIKEKWATFTITNTKTKNDIFETDDILECETKLKNYYNIPSDKSLYILIINISKDDMTKPKLEYEFYYPFNGNNFEKLDLSICSNENFKITNCSTYSLKSILNDLCVSCKEGYFPIYNDPLNIEPFKKCYKDPERYFFDKTISKYKLCFSSCQNCDKEGNNDFHNCLKCNTSFPNEMHFGNYTNCYDECPYYFYHKTNDDKTYCTKSFNCSDDDYNKLIFDKKECIKNCTKDKDYKYEYKNGCYKSCPDNSKESEIKPFYCDVRCPDDNPFLILSTLDCVQFCSIDDLVKQKCIINIKNLINQTISDLEQKLLENIQHQLTNGFDVSDIDNGTDTYVSGIISLFTITNTFNQKNQRNSSKTTIDFKKCENNLKSLYNISENSSLYILRIDTNQTGMKIPMVEYEIYYPLNDTNLVKLNLSICQNDKIDLYFSVEIDDDNLDKYDTNSDYYNDICYFATSDKGTDITLEDRKKEYVDKNLSICGEGCQLDEYDKEKNKSKCNCYIKIQIPFMSEIRINKMKLYESFTNIENNINLKIIKCYKLLFNIEGLKENIGFLIYFSLIFLLLLFLILFLAFDYKKLKNKIDILVYTKENWEMLKKKFKKNIKKTLNTLNRNINNTNNANRNIRRKQMNNKKKNNNQNIIPDINRINLGNSKKNNIINNINNNNFININNFNQNKNNNSSLLRIPPKGINYKNPKGQKPRKKNISSLNTINPSRNNLQKKSTQNIMKSQTKNQRNNKQIQPSSISSLISNKPFEYFENIIKPNDTELNELPYLRARILDKRTYCEFYLSLLKTRHILIFSFFFSNDYNSKIIKIYLFFFIAIINFSVNSLFFNDSTMHEIYEDDGDFDFVYQIPQIIICSLISGVLSSIFKLLSLTERDILLLKQIKKNETIKAKKENILGKIKIKFFAFFVLSFLLQFLFWFYVSCFCAVYRNTQMHLIKDFLISFGISLLYPLGVYFIPGIFRICSLRSKQKDKKCCYDFSKLFQMI